MFQEGAPQTDSGSKLPPQTFLKLQDELFGQESTAVQTALRSKINLCLLTVVWTSFTQVLLGDAPEHASSIRSDSLFHFSCFIAAKAAATSGAGSARQRGRLLRSLGMGPGSVTAV